MDILLLYYERRRTKDMEKDDSLMSLMILDKIIKS